MVEYMPRNQRCAALEPALRRILSYRRSADGPGLRPRVPEAPHVCGLSAHASVGRRRGVMARSDVGELRNLRARRQEPGGTPAKTSVERRQTAVVARRAPKTIPS
jgi:hypothetical protein